MAPFFSFFLPLLSIIFLLSSRPLLVEARHHLTSSRTNQFSKLFVVGDSYVDTGNSPISTSQAWKVPYGMTFPGKPVGRFSDGRVFTDFLAKYLGLERTPMAYRWRNIDPEKTKKYGMNFAVGGTGVFNTSVSNYTFTVQIDWFEEVIKNGTFYTQDDINSSLTYVELSGNDYFNFLNQSDSNSSDPLAFIQEVVDQLKLDLRRIHGLGVGKVAVSALSPLGCSPGFTFKSSFQKCNDTINGLVQWHNKRLHKAVDDLNSETQPSTFVIADLYDAFYSVINGTTNSTIENPLVPCCVGVNGVVDSYCGTVDDMGKPTYTVCPNPDSALFWDMIHPTQAGWRAVFSALQMPF